MEKDKEKNKNEGKKRIRISKWKKNKRIERRIRVEYSKIEVKQWKVYSSSFFFNNLISFYAKIVDSRSLVLHILRF